jgi:hypothetical protein
VAGFWGARFGAHPLDAQRDGVANLAADLANLVVADLVVADLVVADLVVADIADLVVTIATNLMVMVTLAQLAQVVIHLAWVAILVVTNLVVAGLPRLGVTRVAAAVAVDRPECRVRSRRNRTPYTRTLHTNPTYRP